MTAEEKGLIAVLSDRLSDFIGANNREHDSIIERIDKLDEAFTKKLEGVCKRVGKVSLFQVLVQNWFKVVGALLLYTGTVFGIVIAIKELL